MLGAFLALALLGLIALLPPWPHVAVLVLFAVAFLAAAILGFRRFTLPSRAAADRRLEAVNGLAHRPLTVLADQPVTLGPESAFLWRTHVERMARRLARARVGPPHPGLAARDRYALRAGLIVALVAGIVVAGANAPPRLAEAFVPELPAGPVPPAPELVAWLTPPAYTHLPPIFLAPPGGALSAPRDSVLAVSITGGEGAPRLVLGDRAVAFHEIGRQSFRASATLDEASRLVLSRGAHRIGAWDLTLIPPGAPMIAFAATPGADPQSPATRIPWKVSDRYGVTALAARLSLAARPGANPISIPIPLANVDPRKASGTALADLSANPWAGLEVEGVLVGRNGAGASGKSETVRFRLPEIAFHDEVARALIAVRKELALEPQNRTRAIVGLGRLSMAPAVRNGDFGGFLNMRAIAALLAEQPAESAVDEAERRLWELAWHYEAGPTAATRQELAAAERALERALAHAGEKGGPKAAELNRRIAALERAIQSQIEALAKSLAAKGTQPQNFAATHHYDARTFERLAEAMRQAINRGDLESARNQMAELRRLLRQLQNARPLSPNELARAKQFQQAEQAMAALGDVVGREGGLANHAQSRLTQKANGPRGSAAPQDSARQAEGQPGNAGKTPDASTDQAVQQALRRVLGVLMGNLADATGKIPSALGQADIAMRGAAEALGKGANGRAAALEREAIADLQRGGQQAMAAMAAQQGQTAGRGRGGQGFLLGMGMGERPGEQPGGRVGEGDGVGLDPLGRPTDDQSEGGRATGYVAIPDRDVAATARAIQEELRKRDANPALAAPDRAYIDRLLKQF